MVELLEDYQQVLDEIGAVFVEEFDAPVSQVLTANINENDVIYGDLISGGNYYHYASDGEEIGLNFLPDETREINEYAQGFFSARYGINLDSAVSPYEYVMGFYRQDAQVKCKKGGVACGKVCLPKGAVCRKFGSGGNANAMKGAAGKLRSPGMAGAAIAGGAALAGAAALGGAGYMASQDPSLRRGAQVAAEKVRRGAAKAGEEVSKGVDEAKESIKATAQRVEQRVKKGSYGKAAASVAGGAREISKIAGETQQNATNASSKDFQRAGQAVERGVKGSDAAKRAKATAETVQKTAAQVQANVEKAQQEISQSEPVRGFQRGATKASRVARVLGGRIQKAGAKAEAKYNEGEAAANAARKLASENAERAARGEIDKIKTSGKNPGRIAKSVAGRVQKAGAKAEAKYNEGEAAANAARKLASENAERAARGEIEKAARFVQRQATPKSPKKK